MRIAALIVAAGRGSRAAGNGTSVPKQYRLLGGAPVIGRSIGAFATHPRIDGILAAISAEDRALYEDAARPFGARLMAPVQGGATRQESVRAGLEALAGTKPDLVLIHDAARPFVDHALIDRVIDSLAKHAGALPCLPVTDTLKQASGGRVTATVDRDGLWRAQTPQGFKFDAILAAHRAAAAQGANSFSDDGSVAEWFGIDLALVAGAEANEKLTTVEDLAVADARLRAQQQGAAGQVCVGSGYDVHALAPGDAVILCGVSIPHDKTLVGHSDADVGLHALTDALLGAIAEGDIGVHFPPSDERWRGAASEVFLKDAAQRVTARGGAIVHVDVTLLCEAPHIGPHRDAMRARVADILGIDVGQVSVKATTNEGLGSIGRGEGIAAMATATVRLP